MNSEIWLDNLDMHDLASLEQRNPELAGPSGFGRHLAMKGGAGNEFLNAAAVMSDMQSGQVPGRRVDEVARIAAAESQGKRFDGNVMAQPNVAATDDQPELPTTFFGDDYEREDEGIEKAMTRTRSSRKSTDVQKCTVRIRKKSMPLRGV